MKDKDRDNQNSPSCRRFPTLKQELEEEAGKDKRAIISVLRRVWDRTQKPILQLLRSHHTACPAAYHYIRNHQAISLSLSRSTRGQRVIYQVQEHRRITITCTVVRLSCPEAIVSFLYERLTMDRRIDHWISLDAACNITKKASHVRCVPRYWHQSITATRSKHKQTHRSPSRFRMICICSSK